MAIGPLAPAVAVLAPGVVEAGEPPAAVLDCPDRFEVSPPDADVSDGVPPSTVPELTMPLLSADTLKLPACPPDLASRVVELHAEARSASRTPTTTTRERTLLTLPTTRNRPGRRRCRPRRCYAPAAAGTR